VDARFVVQVDPLSEVRHREVGVDQPHLIAPL
jgi:hypothetical protein